MFVNIGNAITRLPMDQLGRNLGGRIPSGSRHVRHDAVAMAFRSYAPLEAERANRFRWNLVHNSKLGPQWQSRDQILKIFKIQKGWRQKYWQYYNSPSNKPIETKLGWSHPITFPTCPPWCSCHGIQKLWASGGRTREPILMKFGIQQQIRTKMTVT